MKLGDFIKDKEFSSGESLPKGDTFITLNDEITEIETEYEGKKKIRYQLKLASGKTYFVGTKVMEGIKENKEQGFSEFRVTKTGEGMKTNYSVIGVKK